MAKLTKEEKEAVRAARATHHFKATSEDEILLELKYPDSMYDMRLFLARDGRKRGLWIFLEEAWKHRVESDGRQFDRGFKEMIGWLKKKKPNWDDPDAGDMFEFVMMLKMWFDYAFGHRTESKAVRLSWRKTKMLARALNKGHRDEKKKTLEDYDDAYGKDPDDDEVDDDTDEGEDDAA